MSILTSPVLKKAGTLSVTGGTSTTFSPFGSTKDGSTNIANSAQTDVRLRENISLSTKPAKALTTAPSGYTQERRTVIIRLPFVLANGKYTVNTVKIEKSADVETSAANHVYMRDMAAQVLFSSDFASFWDAGSLA